MGIARRRVHLEAPAARELDARCVPQRDVEVGEHEAADAHGVRNPRIIAGTTKDAGVRYAGLVGRGVGTVAVDALGDAVAGRVTAGVHARRAGRIRAVRLHRLGRAGAVPLWDGRVQRHLVPSAIQLQVERLRWRADLDPRLPERVPERIGHWNGDHLQCARARGGDEQRMGDDGVADVQLVDPGNRGHRFGVVVVQAMAGIDDQAVVQTADHPVCIALNVQSGGSGISLHDLDGFPRLVLIAPTFRVRDFIQSTGRCHRGAMKSVPEQKVLFASGTKEVDVMRNINRKLKTMSKITDVDFIPKKR